MEYRSSQQLCNVRALAISFLIVPFRGCFLGSEVSLCRVSLCVFLLKDERRILSWNGNGHSQVYGLCMCNFPKQFFKKYFKPSHTSAISIDQRWAATNGSDKQPKVQMLKESLFKPPKSAKLWWKSHKNRRSLWDLLHAYFRSQLEIPRNSLSHCILTVQPWLEIRGKRTYHNFWERWNFEMVEFKLGYNHKRRPGLYFSEQILRTLNAYCCTSASTDFQRPVRDQLGTHFLFQQGIYQTSMSGFMWCMGHYNIALVN